jgi:hypothetical protein
MNNQNIQGIYNYCDRWCERCTFTRRCAVYEHTSELPPEELDMSNKAFWARIAENFTKAQQLLEKAAEEIGVDLEATSLEQEEHLERPDRLQLETRKHSLSLLTLQYSKAARDWLKTQPGMLDRLENLKTQLTLGVESEQAAKQETGMIRDSLAVIQWYLVFIHVKLSRALVEQSARSGEDDRLCDGTAKIALLAIDRSIHSWTALFEILPDQEDHFLRILAMLQRIKAMALQEFPHAMSFIRPGFDD